LPLICRFPPSSGSVRAGREGQHDDLVMATALALWTAYNKRSFHISERVKALFRGV
jgi:hypothetical protein